MPLALSLQIGEAVQIGDSVIVKVREKKSGRGTANQVTLVIFSTLPVEKLPEGYDIEGRQLAQYVLGTDGVPERVSSLKRL